MSNAQFAIDAARRLEVLEKENAALREWKRDASDLCGKGPVIIVARELVAEWIALRKDAERYRWFRSKRLWDADSFPWPKDFEYPEPCLWDDGKMLDAAIDAARKA